MAQLGRMGKRVRCNDVNNGDIDTIIYSIIDTTTNTHNNEKTSKSANIVTTDNQCQTLTNEEDSKTNSTNDNKKNVIIDDLMTQFVTTLSNVNKSLELDQIVDSEISQSNVEKIHCEITRLLTLIPTFDTNSNTINNSNQNTVHSLAMVPNESIVSDDVDNNQLQINKNIKNNILSMFSHILVFLNLQTVLKLRRINHAFNKISQFKMQIKLINETENQNNNKHSNKIPYLVSYCYNDKLIMDLIKNELCNDIKNLAKYCFMMENWRRRRLHFSFDELKQYDKCKYDNNTDKTNNGNVDRGFELLSLLSNLSDTNSILHLFRLKVNNSIQFNVGVDIIRWILGMLSYLQRPLSSSLSNSNSKIDFYILGVWYGIKPIIPIVCSKLQYEPIWYNYINDVSSNMIHRNYGFNHNNTPINDRLQLGFVLNSIDFLQEPFGVKTGPNPLSCLHTVINNANGPVYERICNGFGSLMVINGDFTCFEKFVQIMQKINNKPEVQLKVCCKSFYGTLPLICAFLRQDLLNLCNSIIFATNVSCILGLKYLLNPKLVNNIKSQLINANIPILKECESNFDLIGNVERYHPIKRLQFLRKLCYSSGFGFEFCRERRYITNQYWPVKHEMKKLYENFNYFQECWMLNDYHDLRNNLLQQQLLHYYFQLISRSLLALGLMYWKICYENKFHELTYRSEKEYLHMDDELRYHFWDAVDCEPKSIDDIKLFVKICQQVYVTKFGQESVLNHILLNDKSDIAVGIKQSDIECIIDFNCQQEPLKNENQSGTTRILNELMDFSDSNFQWLKR